MLLCDLRIEEPVTANAQNTYLQLSLPAIVVEALRREALPDEPFPIDAAGSWQGDCPVASREGTMHIDGNPMSVNAIDLYSAAQGEKAAAGERTAEVRKKLLKRSLQSEGGTTPEEALMIGHWLDSRHSQGENEDEYHASAVGIDPDFG